MRILIAAVMTCTLSSALLAQSDTQAPTPPPVKEKKVCREEENTGSMMRSRTCHTKAEWAQIDEANRRAADEFGSHNRMAHSPGGKSGNGGN